MVTLKSSFGTKTLEIQLESLKLTNKSKCKRWSTLTQLVTCYFLTKSSSLLLILFYQMELKVYKTLVTNWLLLVNVLELEATLLIGMKKLVELKSKMWVIFQFEGILSSPFADFELLQPFTSRRTLGLVKEESRRQPFPLFPFLNLPTPQNELSMNDIPILLNRSLKFGSSQTTSTQTPTLIESLHFSYHSPVSNQCSPLERTFFLSLSLVSLFG